MKKLVLVAALFMFVCGGAFLAKAESPVQHPSEATTLSRDSVPTDSVAPVKNAQDTTQVAE